MKYSINTEAFFKEYPDIKLLFPYAYKLERISPPINFDIDIVVGWFSKSDCLALKLPSLCVAGDFVRAVCGDNNFIEYEKIDHKFITYENPNP